MPPNPELGALRSPPLATSLLLPDVTFPGHFLLYICGRFVLQACRAPSAPQIRNIPLQASPQKQ